MLRLAQQRKTKFIHQPNMYTVYSWYDNNQKAKRRLSGPKSFRGDSFHIFFVLLFISFGRVEEDDLAFISRGYFRTVARYDIQVNVRLGFCFVLCFVFVFCLLCGELSVAVVNILFEVNRHTVDNNS